MFLNLGRAAARGIERRVVLSNGMTTSFDYPATRPLVLRTSIRESRLPKFLALLWSRATSASAKGDNGHYKT